MAALRGLGLLSSSFCELLFVFYSMSESIQFNALISHFFCSAAIDGAKSRDGGAERSSDSGSTRYASTTRRSHGDGCTSVSNSSDRGFNTVSSAKQVKCAVGLQHIHTESDATLEYTSEWLPIPQGAIGRIIGKGGFNINMIRRVRSHSNMSGNAFQHLICP